MTQCAFPLLLSSALRLCYAALALTVAATVAPTAAHAVERQARPVSTTSTSAVAGINFSEPARSLPIDTRFSQSIQTVAFDLNLACAQIEAFGWSLAPTEQARVDALFTNTAVALTNAGYRVTPQNPASVAEDITVYTATQPASPKDHKLFVWSAGDAGLLLLICDAKGELLDETASPAASSTANSPLGTPAGFGAYESGPADINPQDLVGVWEGTYTCRSQGKTGGRLAISSVRAQVGNGGGENEHTVQGTLSFFPVSGNTNVERGSYRVSGSFNNVTQQAYFEPGKWLQQPRGYVAKPIIAYFDVTSGKVSAIFQDTAGCTSFEARQKPNSAAEARSTGEPAKKKPRPKRKPKPKPAPAEAAPVAAATGEAVPAEPAPVAAEPSPAPAAPSAAAPAVDSLLPLTPAELAPEPATQPEQPPAAQPRPEVPAAPAAATPAAAAPAALPAAPSTNTATTTTPASPSPTNTAPTPAPTSAPSPAPAPTSAPAEPIIVPNKAEVVEGGTAAVSPADALAKARAQLEAAERAREQAASKLAVPAPAEPKAETLPR